MALSWAGNAFLVLVLWGSPSHSTSFSGSLPHSAPQLLLGIG